MRSSALVITVCLLSFCLVGFVVTGSAEEVAAIEVIHAESVQLVKVLVIVRDETAEPLLIPQCGAVGESDRLCTLAWHLEVFKKGEWTAMATRAGRMLGHLPLTETRRIEPGHDANFVYEFARSMFEVASGDRVRLVVDAWRPGDALECGSATLHLVTAEFKLP